MKMFHSFTHPESLPRVALLFLVFLLLHTTVLNGQSPSIILTPERVSQLRDALLEDDITHHTDLFERLRERVKKGFPGDYGTSSSSLNYERSYAAIELALLYVMTDSLHYAEQAFDILEDMYTSGDKYPPTIEKLGSWPPTPKKGSHGLGHAFPGMAYALCYDWARSGWTTEQTNFVLDSIRAALDDWEALFRWELYDMPTSNWVSVCRGTELLLLIASGEYENRPTRYQAVKDQLNTHFDLSYGKYSGYTYEGLGYLHYGLPFSYVAKYAAEAIGDSEFPNHFSKPYWKLLMYTFGLSPERKHLVTSVDNYVPYGEGLFGLVMGDIPADSLPYYLYFYNRHLGQKAPVPEDERFENKRLGYVWNFIFYPTGNVQEENPTRQLPAVLDDQHFGAFFARNRWQDSNDILINAMGKFVRHEYNSWSVAETFNIGLLGYNTLYFGQAGKDYSDWNFSSLLINNRAYGLHNKPQRDTGFLESFESFDDGMYLVINGGQKYDTLGLRSAKRHTQVKFIDSTAFFNTLDQLESLSAQDYQWHINVGHASEDAGIIIETGSENEYPYFLLSGNNNSYVKGWCLSHPHLNFQSSGVTLEVASATNEDILIVQHVGQGVPPTATFTDTGMETTLHVAGHDVYYDPLSDQIQIRQSTSEIKNLANQSKLAIDVYPNPAHNYVHVTFETPQSGHITLLDLSGETIQSKAFNQQSTINVALHDVPKGMYLLRIETEVSVHTQRIIVLD